MINNIVYTPRVTDVRYSNIKVSFYGVQEETFTKQQSTDAYGDVMRDLPYFNYDEDDDPMHGIRYGPVVNDRGSSLPDNCERTLIIDKLDKATYKTYSKHALPLKP
nr:unnamed protein product [Haemonchus contortus]